MRTNLNRVIMLALTAACAQGSPLACDTGTVTSYLGAVPCAFSSGSLQVSPGTLQITGYSNSFGLSPDQTAVHTNPNGDFTFLHVGNGYTSGPLAWNGAGTVSVQFSFVLPQLGPGLIYLMEENGVDGCCGEPAFGVDYFTGGLLTTSITITSTSSLPPDPQGRTLAVVTDWNYSFGLISRSGQSTAPGQAFYNLEAVEVLLPHAQEGATAPPAVSPEPGPAALLMSGLTAIVVWRNRGRVRSTFSRRR